MEDELYIYNQDIRDRKRTASGARAKKGGSLSKRCTLPSDTLTPAQKRKLNGPCSSVKMDQPITYSELKSLSPSMQFLYLDHLVNVYHARRTDIQEMLGIANRTLQLLFKALPGKLEFKGRPKAPAPEWIAFSAKNASETTQETESTPIKSETPEILSGSITVHTTASGMLSAILRLIDSPDQEYTFQISFTK